MAYLRFTTTTSLALLYLIAFSTPVNALSVAKKAAIGIGVSFGTLLVLSAIAGIWLKYNRRGRAERKARREGRGPPQLTNAEAIALHAQNQHGQFDIWNYDFNKDKAAKKAAQREAAQQNGDAEAMA